MADAQFEWDTQKAADNRRDHGVSFEQGQKAFGDPFAVEAIDERESYGEERVSLIECATARSVRRAEKHEQNHYFRTNAS